MSSIIHDDHDGNIWSHGLDFPAMADCPRCRSDLKLSLRGLIKEIEDENLYEHDHVGEKISVHTGKAFAEHDGIPPHTHIDGVRFF